jgi:hypothetical protein
VPDVVHQLVAGERALDKLAARSISSDDPTQLRHNRYVIVRKPRDPGRPPVPDRLDGRWPRAHARDRADAGPDHVVDRDWLERNRART